jgi:hypothetical protein
MFAAQVATVTPYPATLAWQPVPHGLKHTSKPASVVGKKERPLPTRGQDKILAFLFSIGAKQERRFAVARTQV